MAEQINMFDEKSLEQIHDPQNKGFSRFIVYVDESGDHSIESIDDKYPVFVLAFCVFYKKNYWERVVPSIERFKFQNFGHDGIILHENELRKEKGPFKFKDRNEKIRFLDQLTAEIIDNNFILISCAIDKNKLQGRSRQNAYHIALKHCIESLEELMLEKRQADKRTHIVVEQRGKKEDRELELEFRRICDGDNSREKKLSFELEFAGKQVNSAGLQIADLVARPIGLHILRPQQTNRAFDVLKEKFFCSGGRKNLGEGIHGYGLKIFPES